MSEIYDTKWTTDKTGFIKAVENNEYAEYVLPTGDVLISDVEMGGEYHPYIEVDGLSGELPDDKREELKDELWCDIEEIFDIEIYAMEYSPKNGVFFFQTDQPNF